MKTRLILVVLRNASLARVLVLVVQLNVRDPQMIIVVDVIVAHCGARRRRAILIGALPIADTTITATAAGRTITIVLVSRRRRWPLAMTHLKRLRRQRLLHDLETRIDRDTIRVERKYVA